MWKYLFGPCLYKVFQHATNGRKKLVYTYQMNNTEWLGQSIINSVSYALSISYYCTPIIAYQIYTSGILTSPERLQYYIKCCMLLCVTLASAYVLRGFGRSQNNEYKVFYDKLQMALKDKNERDSMQLYDFDFSAWPVNFSWNESSLDTSVNENPAVAEEDGNSSIFTKLLAYPTSILEYMLGHGLARPMAYPGSVKLLQYAMAPALNQGRGVLYEKGGLRAKLLTQDGNEIDTMFIDNREDITTGKGNTLVICCEGNAAFYEFGLMNTPLQGKYSVLGWNTPGFMGSSGIPSPLSIRNAMDVVYHYALTRLGFVEENVIVFAWSIGGYPASYIAMKYPKIKALVLDATFDSVIPLAVKRMPQFAENLVRNVILKYMNLDIISQLIKYNGPVRIIRRSQEEVITTEPHVASTNRGNYLLIKLFVARYPKLLSKESLSVLKQYLSMEDQQGRAALISSIGGISNESCEMQLKVDKSSFQQYPLDIGDDLSDNEKVKLVLYLANQYMDHFDSTHCVALPISHFKFPWQHQCH